MNLLMAVAAGILTAYAVSQKTDPAWAGPVAGIAVLVALMGVERMRKGRRDAR